MELIVVSDLHLGDGEDYEIFAGGGALVRLVDSLAPNDRLFINGDAVDFLTNDDPIDALVEKQAMLRANLIAQSSVTSAVFRAIGRFIARGGTVTIRLGNHDVELALPAVQAVFRRALQVTDAEQARLLFSLGNEPTILTMGTSRVLITHGEHNDNMNRVVYDKSTPEAKIAPSSFRYPPGSRLVKEFLNPLKKVHRMRYMDLLKPDFQGAVLTAMGTNPAAVRTLLKAASVEIAWSYVKNRNQLMTFEGDDDDLGLSVRLRGAGLDSEEIDAIEELLGPNEPTLLAFDDDSGALARARQKLVQKGLESYARLHRAAAASADPFFSLATGEDELVDVRRLAKKYAADVVIEGHTHAARWHQDGAVVYINTGTWIPLMRLPDSTANDLEWGAFLQELRQNPMLDAKKQFLARLETHFHFVRLSEAKRTVSLEEQCESGAKLLREAPLDS